MFSGRATSRVSKPRHHDQSGGEGKEEEKKKIITSRLGLPVGGHILLGYSVLPHYEPRSEPYDLN
jgi:hypothetical protein